MATTVSEREQLRRAVDMMATCMLQNGCSGKKVRKKLLGEMRRVLRGEVKADEIHRVVGGEDVVSTAGVFQIVLAEHGVRFNDPHAEERWEKIAAEALEEFGVGRS